MIWVAVVVAGIVAAVVVGVWLAARREERNPRGPAATIATGWRELPGDPGLWHEIGAELRAARKIQAIKLLRERTGLGLRAAKDAVEEFERTGRPPEAGPAKVVQERVDEDLAARIRQLKQERRIVEAVKLVRERTGLGLKDAKDVVDAV